MQTEVVLRVPLSPYQAALYDIVKAALRAERAKTKTSRGAVAGSSAVRGVHNTVMELRCICNHPMLRCVCVCACVWRVQGDGWQGGSPPPVLQTWLPQ
jgi:hypothetical protein